jgi:hypothetical protein
MASNVPEVPLDEVRAGDVLWWPGHVGIYAGGGRVIDAYDSRHGVVRRPVVNPRRAFRPRLAPHPPALSQSFEQGFGGSVVGLGDPIQNEIRGPGADWGLFTVLQPSEKDPPPF